MPRLPLDALYGLLRGKLRLSASTGFGSDALVAQ